jgi:hypothetical protein
LFGLMSGGVSTQSGLSTDYARSVFAFWRSSSTRTRRRSLPTADFGSSSRNSTVLGVL